MNMLLLIKDRAIFFMQKKEISKTDGIFKPTIRNCQELETKDKVNLEVNLIAVTYYTLRMQLKFIQPL
jgi:hypothetical protein